MKKGCIYLIENKINGKKYIGQTLYFKKRMKEHINRSELIVDKAINKYGKENFKFKLLENNIKINQLDQKEIDYISKYNTYKSKDYNCHKGGKAMRGKYNPMYGLYGKDNPRYGVKHTQKSKIKISENHHDVSGENNPMYGSSRTGKDNPNAKGNKLQSIKIIKEYNETNIYQKDLAKKYNMPRTMVNKILNCKHWTTEDLKRG